MITTKKELDHIDKDIIRMSSEGMTAKAIGRELKMTTRSIEYRVCCMKKYYQCKSLPQLISKLSKETETSVSR